MDTWTARDGKTLVVRGIRPDDETRMITFHESLSPDTVYSRYFEVFKLDVRVGHERLVRICSPNPALERVVLMEHEAAGANAIVGVGRLVRFGDSEAEFAIVVSDVWQSKGIGTELLRRLIVAARAWGLKKIGADILGNNLEMQRLCEAQGMTTRFDQRSGLARADIVL